MMLDPAIYSKLRRVEVNQTSGDQKTQIVDSNGNPITSEQVGDKTALDVNIVGEYVNTVQEAWIKFDTNTLVPTGDIETVVVSFIVPVGKALYLTGVTATGQDDGIFTVKRDTDVLIELRNSWTERNVKHPFGSTAPLILAGETVSIRVRQNGDGTRWYSGTLIGKLIDA